jgi:hypothetical protein
MIEKSIFVSCNTSDGPAIQLSVSCSPRAVSSIVDLYRHEENIHKTIQIINLEKVKRKKQLQFYFSLLVIRFSARIWSFN